MNIHSDKCKIEENLQNKSRRREKFLAIKPKGKNRGQKLTALVLH